MKGMFEIEELVNFGLDDLKAHESIKSVESPSKLFHVSGKQ